MRLMINITDEEYALLKAQAAAKRKYETGRGFNVERAINEMISIGIDALSQTTILDKEGAIVNWNRNFEIQPKDREIYRRY